MNTCDKCGYKVISNAIFERHMKTHAIDVVEPVVEEPKEEAKTEIPEEPIKSVYEEITLKFTKPIEVGINGIWYLGKEVKVRDMNTASEIVRIAREAYGPSILV